MTDDVKPTPIIDVVVESPEWPSRAVLMGIFEDALAAALTVVEAPEAVHRAEISVLLTDDQAMRDINRDHRGFDKSTNVLSFPALTPEQLASHPEGVPLLLGDMVFAHETIAAEADAGRLTFAHHLTHLIVHSFFHLLGYDHEIDDEAEAMEALEREALARLGLADPYAAAQAK